MTHLITSPVDTLLSPLQIVAGVAAKQSTWPILQHALIRKRGGELEMLASNIDMEISARELVGDPSEDFETTLDARKLYSILRALPKRDVTLTQSAEDSVVLKCRRSRFTLRTLPAVDFPRFDARVWHSLSRHRQHERRWHPVRRGVPVGLRRGNRGAQALRRRSEQGVREGCMEWAPVPWHFTQQRDSCAQARTVCAVLRHLRKRMGLR